jgi:hypothetical protein
MKYLQRLLDTAVPAPVTLAPASPAHSPVVAADQRLAMPHPDAFLSPSVESSPVTAKAYEASRFLPGQEALSGAVPDIMEEGRRGEAMPEARFNAAPEPAPERVTEPRLSPRIAQSVPDRLRQPEAVAPTTQQAPEAQPLSDRHQAPVTQARASRLPPSTESPHSSVKPASPSTTPPQTVPVEQAAPWPIAASDFRPEEETLDTPQLRPTRPAADPAPVPAPESMRLDFTESPRAEPARPVETQPPPHPLPEPLEAVVTERVVERIVERPAERPRTPPPPQTAEQASVIGPLRGLRAGRWRLGGGGWHD